MHIPLLCRIGCHFPKVVDHKFLPSMLAEIVTEFDFKTVCGSCGKVLHRRHKVWDGDDFVDPKELH